MNSTDLIIFRQFVKTKPASFQEKPSTANGVIYTRVSTKE